MALSEVEMVLEFFRRNGLSEAEAALKEDLKEKNEVDVLEFERFLFPMLPPVKIPSRWEHVGLEAGESSRLKSMSEDEFVSMGSSSSNVCSSEFINPYGVQSTAEVESESSSDRLSAFDTARDYHDFDRQNDVHWYDEKDDSYFMTPCYNGSEPFGCASEDKFITTSDNAKLKGSLYSPYCETEQVTISRYGHIVEPAITEYKSAGHMTKMFMVNIDQLDEKIPLKDDPFSVDFDNSAPSSESCIGSVGFYSQNPSSCGPPNMLKHQISYTGHVVVGEQMGDIDTALMKQSEFTVDEFRAVSQVYETAELDCDVNRKESSERKTYTKVVEKPSEIKLPVEDEDVTTNEVLVNDTHDKEYEVFNLSVVHRKNRTGFEANKEFPIILNTMIIGRYYITEYLGSAAFSKVVGAQDLFTGMHVCIKIIKNNKDFFDQSLDEIKLLKYVNKHDPGDDHHILRLYDYFYHQEHLFIVCELLRANLYEYQKFNEESGLDKYFTLPRLQVITRQCLKALEFLHQLGILHCDLKPENILIKSYRKSEIKIIDLGSSCFLKDDLCSYVQSRSYRAPEVILGLPYDQKIDIWSLGCILAELCSGEVLFPNDTIIMILARMVGMFGPFDMKMIERGQEAHKYFTNEHDLYYMNEETKELEYVNTHELPLDHHLQVSDAGFLDFVTHLLETNPESRPTAREALQHPWLSHTYSP